jgi:ElaB/YqjD/DUF883 family membrane-anchored ribosome-binding protein
MKNVADSVKDLSDSAVELGTEAKEQVMNLTDQLRQQATSQLNSQKEQLVDGLETVALLLHQAGEHAQLQDKAMIANYVDKAAEQVSTLSETIGQQDLTQVMQTTKDFARREPMLFVGGALLAGFLGTRFMRSSADKAEQMTQDQATTDRSGDFASGLSAYDMDQTGATADAASGLPAYDIDQYSSTSSDDTLDAVGFSDSYQTDILEGEDLGVDTDVLTTPDIDRSENL